MGQGLRGRGTAQGEVGERGDFYIPDLCAAGPVFVMILVAELAVIVYVLTASALPQFDWQLLASASLFVQWVVLVSAALVCQLRGLFGRIDPRAVALICLGLVMVVTALSSYLSMLYLPHQFNAGEGGWWILRNMVIALVLTGLVLRYLSFQHELQQREQIEMRSQLEALRARIRPHFLFNTLNSIASLIMSRPEAAEKAVEDLAELFRASLEEKHRDTTVADELRVCELYLGIEKLRLGERLQLVWEVDPAVRELPMPMLVMQPLVENAVYHGIARLPAGGRIRVSVDIQGDEVCVAVANPLPAEEAVHVGQRMALDNIRRRLAAQYGDSASLEASPVGDDYRVQMRYRPGNVP